MYPQDADGVYRRESSSIIHKEEHYSEAGFINLLAMQEHHFWYEGRHKFIYRTLQKIIPHESCSMVDLGAGVGGWIKYLSLRLGHRKEISLGMGDSSNEALKIALQVVGKDIKRFQIDLLNLEWEERWDIIFLLDVIEHIPDDVQVMKEVSKALKPNGKIIVTTPALKCFWSHNDDLANHLRRYDKASFKLLAKKSNLKLVDARYFMFFLSPLYWLSRKMVSKNSTNERKINAIEKEHQIPSKILNMVLAFVFKIEAPLGHIIQFPWGTSILGVFEKPKD
jgi:2-polyprenyl-3-methyl-5-hydroxy-6-metoxy-1,4-benzoquinol methylase